jgi:hypothetical protein
MTQYVHPEFGMFCPAPRLRRWLRIASACLVIAVIALAMMATADLPNPESAATVATIGENPDFTTGVATATVPLASIPARPSSAANVHGGTDRAACPGETWTYVGGKCVAGKPRKPRMVRVPLYRPAIASIPLGRNVAPISVGEGAAVSGAARDRDASQPAPPATAAAVASTEPAQRPAAAPKRKTARSQNRRREQYGYGGWREVRVDDWWARGYGSRERGYSRGGYGRDGFFRSFW